MHLVWLDSLSMDELFEFLIRAGVIPANPFFDIAAILRYTKYTKKFFLNILERTRVSQRRGNHCNEYRFKLWKKYIE